jgi:Raf kinase inhibitor-like YbhB/YbcL family protein
MSPTRHIRITLSLGCLLLVAACGDDATPAATESAESGVGASDAGANQTEAGFDGGTSGTDGGAQAALDASGTVTDSGALTSDSAVSNPSDTGAPGDAGTPLDAAPTSDAGMSNDAGTGGTFSVSSPAFEHVVACSKDMPSPCKAFPQENVSYMQDAASATANISPELNWTGVPAGTKSFAVVLQDLTNGLAHWVLWNVPGSAVKLEKNVAKGSAMPAVPAGSQQCNANFAAGNGYFGPGSRCNVYEFVVYALARPMFSPTPATDAGQVRTQLQALGADILGTASLRGRANHMMMCTN